MGRPLWHKANVCKKHLYLSILLLWIFSCLLASIRVYITYKAFYNTKYYSITYYKKFKIYLHFSQVFLGLLISLVTLIFILTFKAAHRAVSNSPSDSNDDRRNK